MQAYSASKRWIDLTHTVYTLRGMKKHKSLLAAVFVSTLAFTSVACDDDATTKKDAGMDRSPDLALTEGGLDRTPDTTTTEVAADKAPDTTTPDGGVDKAPDSPSDAPADLPATEVAADKAPDQAVDLPPDTTADLAPDTTPDTATDTTADANPTGLNTCTVYVDRTGAGDDRAISFLDSTLATDAERCIKVKAGQTVNFSTPSFDTHPLQPFGGDTPSPIVLQTNGGGANFVMTTPGVYGYRCYRHNTIAGAIWVVP
jgi:hypothetical protein